MYFSHPIALCSDAVRVDVVDRRRDPLQPVGVEAGLDERRRVVPGAGDPVVLQPVADLVFAVGRLQRGQLLVSGLRHLLGDLVLDADQDAQRLGGELGLGHHRELVPHVADALAQVGHRAGGGRRRVVELMGQPGGDGAERQQLLALADDLALPPAADLVALEQVHGHRELRLHEPGERVGVEHEAARRLGQPHRRLVDMFLAGYVRRPGAEVDAALRGSAGLDVDAAGALRHDQFAVEHHVEAGRGLTLDAHGARLETSRCGRPRTACRAARRSAPRTGTASAARQRRHSSPIVVVLPDVIKLPPSTGAPTSPPSTLRRRRPPPVWRIRHAHLLQQTHPAHLFPSGAADGPASSRRRPSGRVRTG